MGLFFLLAVTPVFAALLSRTYYQSASKHCSKRAATAASKHPSGKKDANLDLMVYKLYKRTLSCAFATIKSRLLLHWCYQHFYSANLLSS